MKLLYGIEVIERQFKTYLIERRRIVSDGNNLILGSLDWVHNNTPFTLIQFGG